MVIENLHTHVLLEFVDRDLAREAVIGAIESNDLGDQALDKRRSRHFDGIDAKLLIVRGPARQPKMLVLVARRDCVFVR